MNQEKTENENDVMNEMNNKSNINSSGTSNDRQILGKEDDGGHRIDIDRAKDDEIILYGRRFIVLAAYCLCCFAWNLASFRQVMIVTSFAKYYNVSNELVGKDGQLGIDSFSAIPSITVLIGYFMSAMLIDTLGVRMMNIGIFGVAVGCWIWYGAFSSFNIAFAASIIISLTGPFIMTSLLAVSNRFFPDNERAKATATGTLFALIGGCAAFAITPLYETSDRIVNIHLKSCQTQNLKAETLQLAMVNNKLSCDGNQYEDAYNAFCCYTEANIDALNLHFAIITSAIFVFTLLTVSDKPPTPPSHAAKALQDKYQHILDDGTETDNNNKGITKTSKNSSFIQGLDSMKTVMQSKQFVQLTIADFFLSGGPKTVIATVSRLLPASVAEYDDYMILGGIIIAIPTVLITSRYLDKKKTYYTFTGGAYASATILWIIASICISISTKPAAIIFLLTGGMSVAVYIVWQVTAYELKLEYCYRPDLPVEASVIGIDRIFMNISAALFLLAIPPERVGSTNTMWISFGFILLGDIIVISIKDKFDYKRKKYEENEKEKRNNRDNQQQ